MLSPSGFSVNYVRSHYRFHHECLAPGYVSRKSEGRVWAYVGRFGVGYVIDLPNPKSTRFLIRQYYIEDK